MELSKGLSNELRGLSKGLNGFIKKPIQSA